MTDATQAGRYEWTASQLVLTHCIHGLDLRLHPRCYLCTPAYEPGGLTEAWAEAEAALPEGWLFHGVMLVDHSMERDSVTDGGGWGPDWVASMTWPGHCEYDDCDHDEAYRVGKGDTPAEALHALRTALDDDA